MSQYLEFLRYTVYYYCKRKHLCLATTEFWPYLRSSTDGWLRYDILLHHSIQLYIVALHENQIDEVILTDATKYSLIEKEQKLFQIYTNFFFLIWNHCIL